MGMSQITCLFHGHHAARFPFFLFLLCLVSKTGRVRDLELSVRHTACAIGAAAAQTQLRGGDLVRRSVAAIMCIVVVAAARNSSTILRLNSLTAAAFKPTDPSMD
jgi:hypothetical protein